jgi:hypothetical protein
MDDILFETEDVIVNISPLPLGGTGIKGFSMDGEAFDFTDCENGIPSTEGGESSHVFVT